MRNSNTAEVAKLAYVLRAYSYTDTDQQLFCCCIASAAYSLQAKQKFTMIHIIMMPFSCSISLAEAYFISF